MDRPKLTLPKKAPAAELPPEQPALADRVREARRAQQKDEVATHDGDVTVPAAIFQRMCELAGLGQMVVDGAYRPTAEVDQALAAVEELREQMHLAMQHRRPLGTVPGFTPRVEPAAEAEGAPIGTMGALAAALRRRPR